MVTTLNFKDIIDLPKWRPLATPPISVNANYALSSDLRNNEDRHPYIFRTRAAGIISDMYNVKNDQWLTPAGTPTGGTLLTAVTSTFLMPAQGPRGTIAGGATTTSIPLSTALPATVGVNQLANRGDGRGFKIRIIGNAGGSSGKVEERLIVANTGETTTPTLILDSPLSFTPIVGDGYEFLSGRVFAIGNSNGAGSFKYYDILTNSYSGNLATANLPATWSSSNLVGLDELLVPYDRNPGEGFFGNLTATATGAASLTGQAVGGDAGVVANQYRNFQIRIIQDTVTPTAAGQRRNITSHTAGPSPVYTVPAWTVTPSANAVYVIENNGDRIIAWMNGTTQTSTYTISGNAWDANVTFAARPADPGNPPVSVQAFSIEPDTASPTNSRQSHIFSFRSDTLRTLDLFDIAGAATGLWTANITYGNKYPSTSISWQPFTQDPATNQGRYLYMNTFLSSGLGAISGQQFYRFDMQNRVLEQSTFLRVPINSLSSTSGASKAMAQTVFIDGNTKLSFIYIDVINTLSTVQLFFGLPIIR